MQIDLTGKIALVTGASGGIGRATALRLARSNADIVIHYFRERAAAEEVVAEIGALGRKAIMVPGNLADELKIAALFEVVQEQMGGLDILVCNAAAGFLRPLLEQRAKEWDWTMQVNARAALLAAQRAAPLMQARGGGAIVSISSLGSQRVMPLYTTVGMSKAALESLTRYLAVELAPYNITVNAISGGVTSTEALTYFPDEGRPLIEAARTRTPGGQLLTTEDYANLVLFLCSPAARMIRGQTITLDGGFSLVM